MTASSNVDLFNCSASNKEATDKMANKASASTVDMRPAANGRSLVRATCGSKLRSA